MLSFLGAGRGSEYGLGVVRMTLANGEAIVGHSGGGLGYATAMYFCRIIMSPSLQS